MNPETSILARQPKSESAEYLSSIAKLWQTVAKVRPNDISQIQSDFRHPHSPTSRILLAQILQGQSNTPPQERKPIPRELITGFATPDYEGYARFKSQERRTCNLCRQKTTELIKLLDQYISNPDNFEIQQIINTYRQALNGLKERSEGDLEVKLTNNQYIMAWQYLVWGGKLGQLKAKWLNVQLEVALKSCKLRAIPRAKKSGPDFNSRLLAERIKQKTINSIHSNPLH